MKKTILLAVFILIGVTAFAQKDSSFGIKGGLNYNQNGNISIKDVVDSGKDIITGSDSKIGYHIGVFGKLNLGKLYIRPELVYTKTKSDYSNNGVSAEYDLSKLDLPVLVGINIIGPLHIFAGPDFQYILSNGLEGVKIEDVKNKFTYGLQIGVGVNLGKLGLDVRYERGLTSNEANFVDNNTSLFIGKVDSRPSQLIFSLSFAL